MCWDVDDDDDVDDDSGGDGDEHAVPVFGAGDVRAVGVGEGASPDHNSQWLTHLVDYAVREVGWAPRDVYSFMKDPSRMLSLLFFLFKRNWAHNVTQSR